MESCGGSPWKESRPMSEKFSFKIDTSEFGARVSKCGGVATDDGSSRQWALFKREDVEFVFGSIESWTHGFARLARELTGWRGRRSQHAGQVFAEDPHIRIVRDRILVTQDGGVDV